MCRAPEPADPQPFQPAMPRILLIKTSSLGDVVHNLPVVSDLVAALPGVTIDWVVEEAFAAIPRLHPGVSRVLPIAQRRWRRRPWQAQVWRELRQFLCALRLQEYDFVIDTQGLLKSAWIARAARGLRHGLDRVSSREPLGWFYDRVHLVPWGQHAVERNRQLAALALGRAVSGPAQYGVRAEGPLAAGLDGSHAMLLHATSAANKLWPEADWIELGTALAARGLVCVLPWGTPAERERSERLARRIPRAVVPERLGIEALAPLLARAQLVAGTDTGLTHLAGALGAPTLGIYCATDPQATGLHACRKARNLGGPGAAPSAKEVIAAALEWLA
jgi:heptosyltransferase I